MHDLGDPRSDRPVDLVLTYSKHCCPHCGCHFSSNSRRGFASLRKRAGRGRFS